VAQWLEHWPDTRENLRAVVLIPGQVRSLYVAPDHSAVWMSTWL